MRKYLTILFLWISLYGHSQVIRTNPYYTSGTSNSCTDADYLNFVTKVTNNGGSLTTTELTAICTLVKQLKDSSLWTSFIAIYPMVGGSAASCAINLKDTTQFNITWTASPTFTSNGVDFNGSTQYGNTNLTPSTASISLNSAHLSYYSRENTTGSVDIGAVNNPPLNYFSWGAKNAYGMNGATTQSYTNSDSRGLFVVTRTTSTLTTQYRNGASVNTSSIVSTTVPSMQVYIGCRNLEGSGASAFSDHQCAFASIGAGLSAAQALTLYNIVQAFQTTLSRQV